MRLKTLRSCRAVALWCAACSMVLFGCTKRAPVHRTDRATADELDYAMVPTTQLHGSVLSDDSLLANPDVVRIAGNYLVIGDDLADSLILVLERSSGRVVGRTARSGEGPGEAKSVYEIQVASDPDDSGPTFWIFDVALRRLTEFRVSERVPTVAPIDGRIVRLDVNGTPTSALWLDDDRIVSLGFYQLGRLAYFDRQGENAAFRGPLPPNPDSFPATVLQHAYQGSMSIKPDHSQMVVVTRHASQLEFYNTHGEMLRRVDGPFPFTPQVGVAAGTRGPVMSSGGDLRFGYIAVTSTDDHVYALFSGRTRSGYPGQANYGEYVHVFDWDGRFDRALRLQEPAISVAVTTDDSVLYAVSELPRPSVIVYPLP